MGEVCGPARRLGPGCGIVAGPAAGAIVLGGTLAALVGGLDYATVGAAVSRFPRRLARDAALAEALRGIEGDLSNV